MSITLCVEKLVVEKGLVLVYLPFVIVEAQIEEETPGKVLLCRMPIL
jgi:hypothetical protein